MSWLLPYHMSSFLVRYLRNDVLRRGRVEALPDGMVTDRFLKLRRARVDSIVQPRSLAEVQAAVRTAKERGLSVSMIGSGHASDGHQFANGAVMLDLSRLDRVLSLDEGTGVLDVECGVTWDQLVEWLRQRESRWGIHMKQTLLNRATIGGSVAINIHARKMAVPPLIHTITSFVLVDADGDTRRCSREENAELFSLVIGGYGAFGVVYSVQMQLQEVVNLERDPLLELAIEDVARVYLEKAAGGATYGDSHTCGIGIAEGWAWMTTYRPTTKFDHVLPFKNTRMSRFLYCVGMDLLHNAPKVSFALWRNEMNKNRYFTTDSCQFTAIGEYYDDIHDGVLGLSGCDFHVEFQIDPDAWPEAIARTREIIGDHHRYCTFCDLRFVKQDTESALPYAQRDSFTFSPTFHLDESNEAVVKPMYEALFDLVVHELDGRFYLWDYYLGRPDHLLAAYPMLPEFLKKKDQYDPQGRFTSMWLKRVRRDVEDRRG